MLTGGSGKWIVDSVGLFTDEQTDVPPTMQYKLLWLKAVFNQDVENIQMVGLRLAVVRVRPGHVAVRMSWASWPDEPAVCGSPRRGVYDA